MRKDYSIKKIFEVVDGITRAYPIFIVLHTLLSSLLFSSKKLLLLGIILFVSDIFNHFIKEHIFRPLMGHRNYSILGSGMRPNTKDCGLFRVGTHSKSYGLPSGHSQVVWLYSTYWILDILNDKDRTDTNKAISIFILAMLACLVMYSRVYWAKCHTVQQVLVGGVLGIIFGTGTWRFLN